MRLRTRTDIVNFLIKRNGYRRYLEIGVRRPEQNHVRVRAAEKHGVDPDPLGEISHVMTSDEFFARLPEDADPYDIVLVDGLHLADQVMRDVENALDRLSDGGAVLLHDCNPPTEANQLEAYDGSSPWNGTVWKAWARLRMSRPDLAMCVVDTDWGVGVIARGRQELFPEAADAELTFDFLDAHRVQLLNLVPPDAFPRVAGELFGEPRSWLRRLVPQGR